MEYVGVLGGIITTSGAIPQLYKIYKTKSADDLSFCMIGMWITGLTMTLSYGIYTNQFAVYIPSSCSLCMSSLMLCSKFYYSREENNDYTSVNL